MPGTTATAGFRDATIGDLPVAEHRYELAGIPTAVLEGGEGPTVVLLHGPGEFAGLWGRVVPALTETHRVGGPRPARTRRQRPAHRRTARRRALAGLDARSRLADLHPAPGCGRSPGRRGTRAPPRHRRGSGRARRAGRLRRSGVQPTGAVLRGPARRVPRPPHRAQPDRFLGRCMYDFDGMRSELGPRWDPFAAYALDGVRTPGARSAVMSLVMAMGMRPIRSRDLARIPVPVSMIWGRHDLQNRLRIAESAAATVRLAPRGHRGRAGRPLLGATGRRRHRTPGRARPPLRRHVPA